MEKLSDYTSLIEAAISSLGVDPAVCRTEQSNKWHLHRGQAQVVLMIRKSRTHKSVEKDTVVMVSPVVVVPQDDILRQKLYQLLLATSHQMVTESFSIAKEANGTEVAYLSSTYFIEDMNSADVAFMLDSLSYYALKFSEELRAEFMGQKKNNEETKPFKLED
jgi:hypothetical protein